MDRQRELDGLTSTRSKADFRAMRDMLGLSQSDTAAYLGVSLATIKKWEDPKAFYPPRRESWISMKKLVDYAYDRAHELASMAQVANQASQEACTRSDPFLLTYWRTAEDWEQAKASEAVLPSQWKIENAAARMASFLLQMKGIPVSFIYAETNA